LFRAQDDGELAEATGGLLPNSLVLDFKKITKLSFEFIFVNQIIIFEQKCGKLFKDLSEDLKAFFLDLFLALLESFEKSGVNRSNHVDG